MHRSPTNTLIVTKLDKALQLDPDVVAQLLASRNFCVELVYLPKFLRYIIICASPLVAAMVREFLGPALGSRAHVSYSIRDNHLKLLEEDLWAVQTDKTDYLELPSEEGSRRFLILPPLSPQSEWNDYHKEEEGPNAKSIYSPEKLSHLLWDRLGGFDSGVVRRFQLEEDDENSDDEDGAIDISSEPQILFENIDNGVPAIVVDSVTNQGKKAKGRLPKTAIPPPL